MAALLLAFEEKIEGKGLTLSDLSLSSTGSPNHSLLSTPSTTAWFSILSAFLCLSLILFLQCLLYKQSVRKQITAPSAENISAVKNLCELCNLFFGIRYRQIVVIVGNSLIASQLSSIDRLM